MEIEIVPAPPNAAQELTRICFAAKASWGYPPEWMAHWKDKLTFTPESVAAYPVFMAQRDGAILGFYALIIQLPQCILDDLWIDPPYMRQGIGKLLFAHALATARTLGAQQMEWEADPHAVAFYVRMGARHVRDIAGDFGRSLPIMAMDVPSAPQEG